MELLWDIFNWLTAAVTLASVVSAMTPTPKDDAIVAKAKKALDLLAVNIGHAKNKDA
jgi:hypothetical protein|tara:strand:+ start:2601 stop:2771 length:171 start_codon:yes stop_codon:yes gene_type:complete